MPGDEANGRTANPTVSTELAFQRAQRAKREATDALRDGDPDRAAETYRLASLRFAKLRRLRPAQAMLTEADLLDNLAARAHDEGMAVRKMASADHHMKSRRRGREKRPQ